MNPRTQKGQRKIRMSVKKMRGKKKKEKVEERVQPSCDDPGCGCGN